MYYEEIQVIRNGCELFKNSFFLFLNLILDSDGFLWVGGCIYCRQIQSEDNYLVYFIIVLKGYYIVVFLICYYYFVIYY